VVIFQPFYPAGSSRFKLKFSKITWYKSFDDFGQKIVCFPVYPGGFILVN